MRSSPRRSRRPLPPLAAITLLVVVTVPAATALSQPDDVEVVKLIPSDPDAFAFGESVALDGDTAAVSDQRSSGSKVFLFERDAGGPGAWGEVAQVEDPGGGLFGSYFGAGVAIDGDRLAVISFEDRDLDQGVAYLFERDEGGPGAWGLVAALTTVEAERFYEVVLDGDVLVVGAPFAGNDGGLAYVFERDEGGPGAWGQVTTLQGDFSDDDFSDALALDGDTLFVGAPGRGSQGFAYVFERDAGGPGAWGRVAMLDGPHAKGFGTAVTVLGEMAMVTSNDNSGAAETVHRFRRDPGDPDLWVLVGPVQGTETLLADDFGAGLASDGDLAVVAAPGDDVSRGSAAVFARDARGPQAWGQGAHLTAPDRVVGQQFGGIGAVSISGRTVLVGARGDFGFRGAAYVFDLTTVGPFLSVGGECPGTVEIDLAVAAPDAQLLLVGALQPGSSVVPSGPCAGLELGLDRPRLLQEVTTDGLGNLHLEVDLGEAPCGAYLQAVVPSTCLPSNVDRLPQRNSVLAYDADSPADFFVPSTETYQWAGNVFDSALGSPLDGGSLSAVQVYLRDAGKLSANVDMVVFPYPGGPGLVPILERLNIYIGWGIGGQGADDFHTYVLANPVSVPPGFVLAQLMYLKCDSWYGSCYRSGGSLGMDADTVNGQGFHAARLNYLGDSSAAGFERLDANAMLRARGGFGAPLLPVELARPAPETADSPPPE